MAKGTQQGIEELVRNQYEYFNTRQPERAADDVLDDATIEDVGIGAVLRGKEGVVQYMRGWLQAFPDAKIEILSVLASGDQACAELVGRGTHTGTLETPAGSIPATNKKVELRICDFYTIRDGKVAGVRSYFDSGSLFRQLGVSPDQLAGAERRDFGEDRPQPSM